MNEYVFEMLRLIIMISVLIVTRYFVPWIKQRLGNEQLTTAENWVKQAVLKAQQVLWNRTGREKKEFVVDFISTILKKNKIEISERQLDVLIEAAVKEMKIAEQATLVTNQTIIKKEG